MDGVLAEDERSADQASFRFVSRVALCKTSISTILQCQLTDSHCDLEPELS